MAREKTAKTKLTRAEKKQARATKRTERRERWSQMWQAFKLTRERDPRLVWVMLMIFVAIFAVLFLGLTLLGVWWPIALVLGLLVGAMGAMIAFSRRAQKAAYTEAEGQPGAAAWVLQNMRGNWRVTPAVAGTTQLDAVHRVLGRPGVILIGEGQEHRVKTLLSQEKRKVARIVGDTPIYDIVVGRGEGQVPLGKLNAHLVKLPANLQAGDVGTLEKRLAALGGARNGMPKGPIPKNAQRGMSGMQRSVRRKG